MRETLEHVDLIAQDWGKAQASYMGHRRAVFILWTMREVPGLREALGTQMGRIQLIRKQASEAGVNVSGTSVQNLIAELHKAGFVYKDHNKSEPSKQAKKTLKNSGYDVHDPPLVRLTKEQKLKEALKQQDFSDSDVQKLVDLYSQELERKPIMKPAPSPSPGPAHKAHAGVKWYRHCEILVVGNRNGAFSIISQAYLELVRAWTANLGGPWIFSRVDSAGLTIDSAFRRGPGKLAEDEVLSPGGNPCSAKALDALYGNRRYFQTEDYPNEKGEIFKRVKRHRRRGIREEDFTRYNYIICCEKSTTEKLKTLSERAQKEHPNEPNKAQIINIGTPSTQIQNQPLENIVEQVPSLIKTFLKDKLSWIRPDGAIANGPSRTVFFHVQSRKERDALLKNNASGLDKLQVETKCKIAIAWHNKDLGWLVSVTGPGNVLRSARTSILEFAGESK